MFKQIVHKIVNIVIACLLLIATASFSIQKRYCHDQLIAVSIFEQLADCKLDTSAKTVLSQDTIACCTDTVYIFDGKDIIQNKSSYNLGKIQKLYVTAFVYVHSASIKPYSNPTIPYDNYSPPYFYTNKQVLHQSFLI